LKIGGYIPGQNVIVEERMADGKLERIQSLVDELVRLPVDLIFTSGGPGVIDAGRRATSTIPIICIDLERDPVASGLVKSLAHPGGNLTGLFLDLPEIGGKLIQLLLEAAPAIRRLAVLWETLLADALLHATEAAAQSARIVLVSLPIATRDEFDGALTRAKEEKIQGLVVLSSPVVFLVRQQIVEWTLRYRIPAISLFTIFPSSGFSWFTARTSSRCTGAAESTRPVSCAAPNPPPFRSSVRAVSTSSST
jgi:putative ABC transport system substrate-binding protein